MVRRRCGGGNRAWTRARGRVRNGDGGGNGRRSGGSAERRNRKCGLQRFRRPAEPPPRRERGEKQKAREAQTAGGDPGRFDGRVQQRMERMFGALTRSMQTTPPPRLNPFRSFGGLGVMMCPRWKPSHQEQRTHSTRYNASRSEANQRGKLAKVQTGGERKENDSNERPDDRRQKV